MRTSASQFQLLVEFMERNGDLSKPSSGPQGRLTNIQQWAQLTEILNADSTGDTKTADKWRKVWSDLKNNVKKKTVRIHRHAIGTGGGPASKLQLTELEQRVMDILGPQAATGIVQVDEIGLCQEDIQSDSPSILNIHSGIPEGAENSFFILWNQPGTSSQTAQCSQNVTEPPTPSASNRHITVHSPEVEIHVEVPTAEDTMPTTEIPEVRQQPTPLPPTPRRRRRLLHTVPSPSRRRTCTQTQSELARQAFVNSDNEWRVFQRECERERVRLRQRELDQQERWLDLFAQFLVFLNRTTDNIVHIYRNP